MGSLGMGCRGRVVTHAKPSVVRVRPEKVEKHPVFVPRGRSLSSLLAAEGVRPLNVQRLGQRILGEMSVRLHRTYRFSELKVDLVDVVEGNVVGDAKILQEVLRQEGVSAALAVRELCPLEPLG